MTDTPGTSKVEVAIQRMNGPLMDGALLTHYWKVGECSVIVGREPCGPGGRFVWHLSIAHRERYPTWDEIKAARYMTSVPDDVSMVQILPATSETWTNLHDNCFHLYEVPTHLLPDSSFV